MQAIADPATHVPLWMRARAMCARAIAAVGEPQDLAVRGALACKTKYDIAAWLARLESIVRKLLLALAAMLFQNEGEKSFQTEARSPRRALPTPAPPRDEQGEVARFEVDRSKPETWRAPFKLAPPRDPCAVPESRAPRIRALWGPTPPSAPPPPPRTERQITEPVLRFAIRLEALKRVLKDPLPYAYRLARILRRLVRRYPRVAERYAIAPARPCVGDEGDPRLIIDAISAAMFGAPILAVDTS